MATTIETFKASGKFSPELIDELKKVVKQVSIKKGTVLQRTGDSSLSTYLVINGLLKSYTIDEKGKEHIFMFASEKWVIGDIDAHSENSTAQLFIEAIEDSEIEIIDPNFLKLFKQFPQPVLYNELERLLKRTSVLQKRILMLMSHSAKERYDEFLKMYPELVQRVPQKLIASYLGITPQTLSVIRGTIY
ncbi:MAG: Crp/Fnr family transcriptional regulator [Flavobacteriaceae bacterium]|nr:Crp/Fnr family transcriptional regulator [Flavobacteriaceae bacterium]